MDVRWIVVRDHQARLLAEAAEERLARLARRSTPSQPAPDPSAVALAAARVQAGRQLIGAGVALAGQPKVTGMVDCPEPC